MIDPSPQHIPDSAIEGSNKNAGRKKQQMKLKIMAAWESFQRQEPMSLDNLFRVTTEFVRRKLARLDFVFLVESDEMSEDFAQKVLMKLWRKMSHGGMDHFTAEEFYYYLNRAAFTGRVDGFKALDEYRRTFVKQQSDAYMKRNDYTGSTSEDAENEHPEIVKKLVEPTAGFHGRWFRPPIPFREMTENEKRVCAVYVNTPQERRMDGLVDRIVCHDGLEYYDVVPVRTYADVAQQLARWTGQAWTPKKVSNIVHRLNKKGEAYQAAQRAEVERYRAEWQAREQRRRDGLGIELPVASLRLVTAQAPKTKGWYQRKIRQQRAEIFRSEAPGPVRVLTHDGQRVIHGSEAEVAA